MQLASTILAVYKVPAYMASLYLIGLGVVTMGVVLRVAYLMFYRIWAADDLEKASIGRKIRITIAAGVIMLSLYIFVEVATQYSEHKYVAPGRPPGLEYGDPMYHDTPAQELADKIGTIKERQLDN